MKIAYLSDMHVDAIIRERVSLSHKDYYCLDALIIAGDYSDSAIRTYSELDFLLAEFNRYQVVPPHVIFVPGNHDYYGLPISLSNSLFENLELKWKNFTFLRSGKSVFLREPGNHSGVHVIGDILRTDFNLYTGEDYFQRQEASIRIRDFSRTYKTAPGLDPWTVEDHRTSFIDAVKALETEVQCIRQNDVLNPIMVVTHFAPSVKSIHPQYGMDPYRRLNAYFASGILDKGNDAYSDILAGNVHTWIHGHTHTSLDYMIGDVRVLNNPRGRTIDLGKNENPDFERVKIISF